MSHDELQFFKSYLTDRTQCCSVNGEMSSFGNVTCGVPQGSILGPLLLIIYVNDLPSVALNSKITMYADDTALSSRLSKPSALHEKLVPDFMRICEWLKANRLGLNIIKTEYMIIGTAQNLIQFGKIPGINKDNTVLKRVPFTKSLGIIIDETLSWENHVEYISTEIKCGIGVLGRSENILSKELLSMLYKTLTE